MKSKQLANVLTKMLGLSVLVHNISPLISGFFVFLLPAGQTTSTYGGRTVVHPDNSLFFFTALITTFIGIFLIVKSKAITGFLFRSEDE